ncbi:MAG: crossover junction endodeoxyribonuclease RuvC [Firmicutes bacterium]|nr:crossover junction endodeoxyribonuclease RuvC [Bacillota bacterium]
MRILGIDPGIAITGFGVVQTDGQRSRALDYGCITTPSTLPVSQRLLLIFQEMQAIFERHQPDAVAIEKLFFAKNANSAMQVGEARGVLVLAASLAGLEVFEYTPLQVKQAVVGYGKAEKKQVQQMVKIILTLSKIPRPDDAADGLAIALCHAHSGGSRAAINWRSKNV